MSLHQKIEERKNSINTQKRHLSFDFESAKKRLTAPSTLGLTAVGGLAVGFLFLPKKFVILKSLFKAYSMAATLTAFIEAIPHKKGEEPHPTPHTFHEK
jgi:hypothetical protein